MTEITTLHFGIYELLIASFWCFGFWKAFDTGMIFESIDTWARGRTYSAHDGTINVVKGHMPGWLYKPLMGCVICMASFHGVLFYVVVVGLDEQPEQLFLFVVALSGLNFLLSQLVRE